MDRITKNQRIKSLENTVDSLTKAVNKLTTWSVYADSLLTELSHALPDPEHDAECEQSVIAVDKSLDRHAARLGLSKPQPALRGSELCRAMLERGDKWVVCKVADTSESDAIKNSRPRMITHFDDDDGFYQEDADMFWAYAVPIDMNSNEITEPPLSVLNPGDILRCTDPHDYFQGGANYLVCESDEGPVVFDGSHRPWVHTEVVGDQLLFRHYLFDTPAAFVKSEVTYG